MNRRRGLCLGLKWLLRAGGTALGRLGQFGVKEAHPETLMRVGRHSQPAWAPHFNCIIVVKQAYCPPAVVRPLRASPRRPHAPAE